MAELHKPETYCYNYLRRKIGEIQANLPLYVGQAYDGYPTPEPSDSATMTIFAMTSTYGVLLLCLQLYLFIEHLVVRLLALPAPHTRGKRLQTKPMRWSKPVVSTRP